MSGEPDHLSGRLARALSTHIRKHGAQLQRLASRIDARHRQLDEVRLGLTQVSDLVRKQTGQSRRMSSLLTTHLGHGPAVLQRLDRIAESDRPIIVGPWTGEVGYEVLYWIPFVRWFVEQFSIDTSRICVVSRGGPESWYQGLGSRYIDALSFFSPDEFRTHPGRRAWMKQDEVGNFDYAILRRVRASIGTRPLILHPMLMFRLFKGYWGGRVSLNEVLNFTRHMRLARPQPLPGLPARYTAVRFYFRSSFPDSPSNLEFVRRALTMLTSDTDVVLLNAGARIDDHRDYICETNGRLHTIDHLITPETNLEVQTAAIAGADAFVGSYGGFAYLAPLLGVESLSFYTADSFKACHLELAEHAIAQVGGAPLTVLDTADLDLVRCGLSPVARVPA